MEFSIELENERTGEVKVLSFDSEAERAKFIEKLPDDIQWFCFENGSFCFNTKADWEKAL